MTRKKVPESVIVEQPRTSRLILSRYITRFIYRLFMGLFTHFILYTFCPTFYAHVLTSL